MKDNTLIEEISKVFEDRDTNTGKFKKGNKASAKPKRKVHIEGENQKKLNAIFREAGGNSIEFYRLLLERAEELELPLNIAMKIASDLAPYQQAKVKPVDEQDTKIIFNIIDLNLDPQYDMATKKLEPIDKK